MQTCSVVRAGRVSGDAGNAIQTALLLLVSEGFVWAGRQAGRHAGRRIVGWRVRCVTSGSNMHRGRRRNRLRWSGGGGCSGGGGDGLEAIDGLPAEGALRHGVVLRGAQPPSAAKAELVVAANDLQSAVCMGGGRGKEQW